MFKLIKVNKIDTVKRTCIMNFNFHRLVRPINVSQLLFIDYMDYIDWFPVIDFHQFGTPGKFKFCHYSCTL